MKTVVNTSSSTQQQQQNGGIQQLKVKLDKPAVVDKIGKSTKMHFRYKKSYKDYTYEEISQYFHLPIKDVSEKLSVSVTFLKKVCRRLNIPRWPFRKINSIQKKISQNVNQNGEENTLIISPHTDKCGQITVQQKGEEREGVEASETHHSFSPSSSSPHHVSSSSVTPSTVTENCPAYVINENRAPFEVPSHDSYLVNVNASQQQQQQQQQQQGRQSIPPLLAPHYKDFSYHYQTMPSTNTPTTPLQPPYLAQYHQQKQNPHLFHQTYPSIAELHPKHSDASNNTNNNFNNNLENSNMKGLPLAHQNHYYLNDILHHHHHHHLHYYQSYSRMEPVSNTHYETRPNETHLTYNNLYHPQDAVSSFSNPSYQISTTTNYNNYNNQNNDDNSYVEKTYFDRANTKHDVNSEVTNKTLNIRTDAINNNNINNITVMNTLPSFTEFCNFNGLQ